MFVLYRRVISGRMSLAISSNIMIDISTIYCSHYYPMFMHLVSNLLLSLVELNKSGRTNSDSLNSEVPRRLLLILHYDIGLCVYANLQASLFLSSLVKSNKSERITSLNGKMYVVNTPL